MATTRQRPRSASHCKTRIYVTTLPPCLPHTGEETVGPPKGPPPPKGVRKGVITTFINTTGRQVQTKRNLPTHRPLRYRIFFLLDWCVGSHQGGDDPHRPPPGPPVGKRDLSGNGESGDARFSLKGGNRLCQHADRYRTVWYHQPVSTRPSLGEVR